MVQSIRSLRIFVTVAQELHFRKAAERLHMTQPPLSIQIKKLEESIGVDLFSRTTRSVALTPAGQELQRRAVRFLAELDSMKEAVRRAADGTTGTLRLGFNPSTMFNILPRLLEVQRSRYPNVSLFLQELPSRKQLELLRNRDLDVALVRATPAMFDPDLVYRVVTREALLLALPLDHPLARLESVPIQALHDIPFIGFSASGSSYFRDLTQTIFQQHGIQPQQKEDSVLPTILVLVEAGLGVAIVPESTARLREQALTYRPITGLQQNSTVPLYVAWRKQDSFLTLQNFIDIVKQFNLPSSKQHGGAVRANPTFQPVTL